MLAPRGPKRSRDGPRAPKTAHDGLRTASEGPNAPIEPQEHLQESPRKQPSPQSFWKACMFQYVRLLHFQSAQD
eukprot:7932907-Pyramimonas_sp.AAC.1